MCNPLENTLNLIDEVGDEEESHENIMKLKFQC